MIIDTWIDYQRQHGSIQQGLNRLSAKLGRKIYSNNFYMMRKEGGRKIPEDLYQAILEEVLPEMLEAHGVEKKHHGTFLWGLSPLSGDETNERAKG